MSLVGERGSPASLKHADAVTGGMIRVRDRGWRSPALLKRVLRSLVLAPVIAYSKVVSPALPRRCRYEPTCSAYAIEAVRRFGPARGLVLAAWRLLRCNPFSDGGYDPVQAQRLFRQGL